MNQNIRIVPKRRNPDGYSFTSAFNFGDTVFILNDFEILQGVVDGISSSKRTNSEPESYITVKVYIPESGREEYEDEYRYFTIQENKCCTSAQNVLDMISMP